MFSTVTAWTLLVLAAFFSTAFVIWLICQGGRKHRASGFNEGTTSTGIEKEECMGSSEKDRSRSRLPSRNELLCMAEQEVKASRSEESQRACDLIVENVLERIKDEIKRTGDIWKVSVSLPEGTDWVAERHLCETLLKLGWSPWIERAGVLTVQWKMPGNMYLI